MKLYQLDNIHHVKCFDFVIDESQPDGTRRTNEYYCVYWTEIHRNFTTIEKVHKKEKYKSEAKAKKRVKELYALHREWQKSTYKYHNGYTLTSEKEMRELEDLDLPEI